MSTDDLGAFNSINNKFLNPPGVTIRHTPIKIYLPSAPQPVESSEEALHQAGKIRVVQNLVAPLTPSRKCMVYFDFFHKLPNVHAGQVVTLGKALNSILPTVFPSTRTPIHARPVMHGAVLPMNAPVEDLLKAACYADGYLHVAVIMLG